jgi:hypothetical protein
MACRVAKVTSVTGYKMLILSGLWANLGTELGLARPQKRAEPGSADCRAAAVPR